MRVRILGCGTSTGVPRIGNDWGSIDPAEPRNRRRRVSILVSDGATRILVDTGPDMREQLIDAGAGTLDAVIWTHEHADHVHGIDDLRQLFLNGGGPLAGYAGRRTLASLTQRFDYVFNGRWGYPATVVPHLLEDGVEVGPIAIRAVEQPHGEITATSLLFISGGKSVGYATDFNALTEEAAALFAGADLWILDALRHRPHPSHNHLDQALDYIARVSPKRALLTHMGIGMDYRSLLSQLPPHVEPAYDGMEIAL